MWKRVWTGCVLLVSGSMFALAALMMFGPYVLALLMGWTE